MHSETWLIALLLVALPASGGKPEPDEFTPLIASPLMANTQPFLGTDGKWHVVYELVLTNTTATPATLQNLRVFDAHHPSVTIAFYNGAELRAHLRTLANTAVAGPEIEFNGTRLFLIDLTFDSRDKIPDRLQHHVDVLAASSPGHRPTTPVPLSYSVAPFDLTQQVPEIGAPLAGKEWVALNGCCGMGGVHRTTGLPVNGRIYFAQRFAIDWMRLDEAGRLVHGDPSDVNNYSSYGADVTAVADGTVVETLNTLDDQTPGKLPDAKAITLANVDGNHIILDLGNGVFAFYAHLQKNSVRIAPGHKVKRGQVLGKLGNTGNTSAPHLHFQLMDGPSALGSNGIPYVIDGFTLAGQIPQAKFAAATGVEGNWRAGLLSQPSPRHQQFPLDLAIIDFSLTNESAR
ncbi:MAG: M23 family metallopeptidase [Bryobacteraceae bacterium]